MTKPIDDNYFENYTEVGNYGKTWQRNTVDLEDIEEFYRRSGVPKPTSMLDLGCADGSVLKAVGEMFDISPDRLVGVESNLGASKLAQSNIKNVVHTDALSYLDQFDYDLRNKRVDPNQRFDLILINMLMYVTEPWKVDRILHYAAKVSHPDTIVIIVGNIDREIDVAEDGEMTTTFHSHWKDGRLVKPDYVNITGSKAMWLNFIERHFTVHLETEDEVWFCCKSILAYKKVQPWSVEIEAETEEADVPDGSTDVWSVKLTQRNHEPAQHNHHRGVDTVIHHHIYVAPDTDYFQCNDVLTLETAKSLIGLIVKGTLGPVRDFSFRIEQDRLANELFYVRGAVLEPNIDNEDELIVVKDLML